MTLRIYRPDEQWPTKRVPSHFGRPIAQAQAAGWTLHHHGADHWFGTLVCPAGEDDPYVHTFKVDGTATGSAFWAAEASKTVTRKCHHGAVPGQSKVKDRQAECERLLAGAETLLDRVEEGLGHAEAYQTAVLTLSQLDMQLEAAEASVHEALPLGEIEEAVLQDAALQAVYDSEGAPAPSDLDRDLGAAEDAVAESNLVASRLRRARERLASELLQRGTVCSDRIGELRIRLDRLMAAREAADI